MSAKAIYFKKEKEINNIQCGSVFVELADDQKYNVKDVMVYEKLIRIDHEQFLEGNTLINNFLLN